MDVHENTGYDSTKRNQSQAASSENWNQPPPVQDNKKLICGILAIVIGWTGIHKFLLGYTKEGILQIILSLLCGIGAVIALIEGIIYLTKSDAEFYQTYQVGKRGWF